MISEREVSDEVVTATAALELQTGLVRAEIFTSNHGRHNRTINISSVQSQTKTFNKLQGWELQVLN